MQDVLFFDLIRVALGNAVCLSRTPSVDEWDELYAMAKKQALVGICFAGVQMLQAQRQMPPERQYLQWMGMTAKIQQRNEIVTRQCVEVQEILRDAGFHSAILKGQGIGSLYGHLSLLRQSGDIDVWVEGGMQKALNWCQEKYGFVEYDYINAHVPVFDNTEVELHWRAQALTNLFANSRLQKWLTAHEDEIAGGKEVLSNGVEITTPSAEFNAFYILLHCYHHMFESGLGLRQLMDYYFALKTLSDSPAKSENLQHIQNTICEFGLERFAKGVMWIMQYVFGLKQECLICESDEKEGRFLLKEVMQNGNFGHHDERIKTMGGSKMNELWRNIQHNWHLVSHYPMEMIWQPVWLCYHCFWKRTIKN